LHRGVGVSIALVLALPNVDALPLVLWLSAFLSRRSKASGCIRVKLIHDSV
jgi:hypothetical protein